MWDVKPCSTQLNASNEARLDDRSDRPASMSICSNVTLRRVPNFELLMLTAEQSTSAVLCPATSTNWPSHCNSRYCHAAAAGCSTGRPIGRNNDVKSDTVIIRQSLFIVDCTQCQCAASSRSDPPSRRAPVVMAVIGQWNSCWYTALFTPLAPPSGSSLPKSN